MISFLCLCCSYVIVIFFNILDLTCFYVKTHAQTTEKKLFLFIYYKLDMFAATWPARQILHQHMS